MHGGAGVKTRDQSTPHPESTPRPAAACLLHRHQTEDVTGRGARRYSAELSPETRFTIRNAAVAEQNRRSTECTTEVSSRLFWGHSVHDSSIHGSSLCRHGTQASSLQ